MAVQTEGGEGVVATSQMGPSRCGWGVSHLPPLGMLLSALGVNEGLATAETLTATNPLMAPTMGAPNENPATAVLGPAWPASPAR